MVLWGAICGAVLGLLWRGHDWEFHLVVGAVFGALACLGLRRAVRTEIQAALAAQRAGALPVATAPTTREQRPAADDFQNTIPQPLPAAPVPAAAPAPAPAA